MIQKPALFLHTCTYKVIFILSVLSAIILPTREAYAQGPINSDIFFTEPELIAGEVAHLVISVFKPDVTISTNVRAVFTLPAGMEFLNSTGNCTVNATNQVTCRFGPLFPF